jgi:hypothetical protein
LPERREGDKVVVASRELADPIERRLAKQAIVLVLHPVSIEPRRWGVQFGHGLFTLAHDALAEGRVLVELDAQDAERLRAAGVTVDQRPAAGLRGPDSTLTAVVFADGSERPLDGLLVPVTLHQRSALAEQLGAAATGPGSVVVDAVEVDPMFHTSVPGLSAAGDVSAQMPSAANAVAAGASAAAMIVHGLMAEAHGLTPVGTGSDSGR